MHNRATSIANCCKAIRKINPKTLEAFTSLVDSFGVEPESILKITEWRVPPEDSQKHNKYRKLAKRFNYELDYDALDRISDIVGVDMRIKLFEENRNRSNIKHRQIVYYLAIKKHIPYNHICKIFGVLPSTISLTARDFKEKLSTNDWMAKAYDLIKDIEILKEIKE